MVKEYLINCQQELLSRKIDLQKELQKNELSRKEVQEFLRLIQSVEDKPYESFTPQNYKNDKNMRTIKELKERQESLEEAYRTLQDKIQEVNEKIQEIEELLHDEIFERKMPESQAYEMKEKLENSTLQALIGVYHKLELCNNFIDIDRNRCKLELKSVREELGEIIHHMESTSDEIPETE